MSPEPIRAPREDGGLIARPPIADCARVLDDNRQRLDAWEHDFQGRAAHALRSFLRRDLLNRARAYHERFGLDLPDRLDPSAPWIVTGHQPELFHPGVWVKNFAVAGLSRRSGGIGLNLIIDNDVPKSALVRVPTVSGESGRLEVARPPIDAEGGESPYEDLPVLDEPTLRSFGDRARSALGGLIADPLIDSYWPRVIESAQATDRLGLRLASARRRVEADWGVHNLELPLSEACQTDGFLWFAAHLIAHLPRFRTIHNEVLETYRRAHRIRSRHHPVPELDADGDWLEAPFWVWRSSQPRRRPVLARARGRSIDLRIAGEAEILAELPLAEDREACCAVERLRDLAAQGVRLRTRALTTTMFARLLVGDLFVHGIGGAKYDELGDAIVRRFFRIDPPAYLTLSLTLWMGLPTEPIDAEQARGHARWLRDLEFNPQRHLDPHQSPELAAGIAQRWAAVDLPTASRRQRLARNRAIREANRALAPFVEADRQRGLEQRGELRASLRRNAIARSREYAFPLHGSEKLRRFLLPFA